MDRGAWWVTVHGVARVRHDLATKLPPPRQWENSCGTVIFSVPLLHPLLLLLSHFSRVRRPTRLPVPGILQARILEWVSISFSSA